MPIAEVTVIPIGTGSTSLSSYVADMQRVLKTVEGITYELTSMGTIIEGPLQRILAAVEALHESPFASGAQRVSTSLKLTTAEISPPLVVESWNLWNASCRRNS